MDKENISWKLIDKYFKDNPNCLVSHHLESFNDFFKSGIKRIFHENNPIRFIEREEQSDLEGKRNECLLYLGGKEGTQIYYGKPVIYDDNDSHYMFPNDARLRNMTYGITIHYDVEVLFTYYVGDEKKTYTMTINKVYLGRFPIMLQSDLCIFNGMSREVRFNAGECRNDYGGYFIIDGKEKVVIPQEKFADNMLYIRKYKEDDLYSFSAEIRSVSEDSSKPIRTTSVKIVAPSTVLSNNQIVISVPNVKKPVPLFILMRALGVISDKDIIKTCLLDIDKNASMVDLFIPSVHDANKFFTQQNALQFIAELTKRGTISSVIEILSDYFLPHIGELNFLEKAYFVGYMVYRLLKVYTKEAKPTDRDNFRFKRVELSGTLIYDLFREYYLIQKKDITRKIDEEYYYHKGSYKEDNALTRKEKQMLTKKVQSTETNKYKDNFIGLIEANIKSFFKDRIVEQGFKKAFKGNWGSETHTKRLGVVQDLNRLSWYTFISHLRKINLPLDSSAKVVGPRLLNSSQWGFIDPIDTPDGGNIGLHKHLAISTYITSGSSGHPIIKWIRSNTPLRLILECCTEQLANSSKVFINGSWIGVTDAPFELINLLKLYRRNGILPIYTSLSFDIQHNEVYIYTDAGRLTRPIYFVDRGKLSYERSDLIEALNKGSIKWENIISGFMEKADEKYHTKNNMIYEIGKLYPTIGNAKEEVFQKLEKNKALVDYIDTSEEEAALVAIQPEDLKKNKYYTHMEIDPSLILGVMTNLAIYPEHNPSTRNAFSCGQSKQAVSVYHSNYQMRIDKMGVILNYGQTPLIKSRYLDYINREEQPYGVNAIVAIMAYTGYNVEDAMLINEGSILRGMFRTTYYSMYEAKEESSKVTGMKNSKFANVEKNNVVGKKKGYDYSFLDDYGLIKENTELNDKTIVIGKINSNLTDKDTWIDDSVKPKKGQLGYVDKSFITLGEEGFNVAKVRLREERIPAIGDKMACALPTQQLLTNEGWIEIKDIDIQKHKVATLDISGNMCYEYPTNKFIYDYTGQMYSVKNKQVEIVCTPNHKLYVSRDTKVSPMPPSFLSIPSFELIEAEKIMGENNITFKKNMNNLQTDLEYIIVNENNIKCDDYLYSIISNYKNENIFDVKKIFSTTEDELPNYIWDMSRKQCLIILHLLRDIKNISLQLANSISRFYVHCGFSCVIQLCDNDDNNKDLYQVNLIENNEPLINSNEWVVIEGETLAFSQVYCIEMPSSHLYYMRENNFAPSMLCGNSRAGQKGTIGLVIPEADMPYLEDGTRPDLIINPHAIPSRMTIGQIVESLFGIACVSYGGFGDCTAFQVKGSNYDTYGPMLTKAGFNHTGNHIMYNGMTGEQIQSNIYMGPTYYMRLKHMVKDKINYRARGPNQQLTRQPVQGRANDGGLRIGEMERDSICSHGLAYFLNESFLIRGDEYYMAICNKTGAIAIYNEAKNLFLSPYSDGPINFHTNPDGTMNIKNLSKFGRSFSLLRIPYSLKLLIQELQVMNIQMRIITDENVDQLLSMSYSNNINKLLHKDPDNSVEKMDKIIKEYAKQMTAAQTTTFEPYKIDEVEMPSVSPDINPETPPYAPGSPDFNPETPPYAPGSPVFNPESPPYAPGSPVFNPESPPYAPGSPVFNPESPPYAPDSNPESPPYAPDSNPESPPYAPDSPVFNPELPTIASILEVPKEPENKETNTSSDSEDKKVIENQSEDISDTSTSTSNETKKINIL
jgi:DNA-directed RNA polymerase II subunit RPB2